MRIFGEKLILAKNDDFLKTVTNLNDGLLSARVDFVNPLRYLSWKTYSSAWKPTVLYTPKFFMVKYTLVQALPVLQFDKCHFWNFSITCVPLNIFESSFFLSCTTDISYNSRYMAEHDHRQRKSWILTTHAIDAQIWHK